MINKRIDIWENTENKYKSEDGFRPYMDTYILDNIVPDKERPAVLICPGGGYEYTSKREAEPIAMQFVQMGYDAFVLYYSVFPNIHPKPLLDLSRAVCIIRENAKKWDIDKNKIAVCGFSAGGHLAASLAVYWDKDYLNVSGSTVGKNKPNASILCYPVINAFENSHKGSFDNLLGDKKSKELLEEMSLERHISEITPPTFLWHTGTDDVVPVENSLIYANALAEKDILFEMHIYPKGYHGLALANSQTDITNDKSGTDFHIADWINQCRAWIEDVFS